MDNFETHYHKDEIDEGIGDTIKAVAKNPLGAIKDVAKGAVRSVTTNLLRGVLGQKKKVTVLAADFNILSPVSKQLYIDTVKTWANYYTKKSPLGKKKVVIEDMFEGEMGSTDKKNFISMFNKYGLQNVDLENKDNPPAIVIYKLSGMFGKLALFDLPVENNPDQRIYAIGMDGKGEKAFEDMTGMTFKNYVLASGKGADYGMEDVQATKTAKLTMKTIDKDTYMALVPESQQLDNLIKEARELYWDIGGAKKWKVFSKDGKVVASTQRVVTDPQDGDIALNPKTLKPDPKWQREIDRWTKKKIADEVTGKVSFQNSKLLQYLDTPPQKLSPGKDSKDGWGFQLKNGGQFYIYTMNNGEHRVAYDQKAADILPKIGIEVETLKVPE